jgi:hypothetical protein
MEQILGLQAASKSLGHRSVNTTLLSYIAQPDLVNEMGYSAIENMYSEEAQAILNKEDLSDDHFEI